MCVLLSHVYLRTTKENQKEELTSPTRTKERTEHRSQTTTTTTSYGNYYSKKQEQEHQQKKIKQEQAHNVRGNVFIKRQKI